MTDETRDQTAELRREAEAFRSYVDVAPEDVGVTLPTAEQLMFRAEATARRRARRTQLLQVVAASVAVAAVVVGLSWRGGDDGAPVTATPEPTPSVTSTQPAVEYRSARQVLRAAAEAAAQQPAAADSAYWYVESLQYLPEGLSPRKFWIGHDRPSVLDQDGQILGIPDVDFSLGMSSLTWDELVALRVPASALLGLLQDPGSAVAGDQAYDRFKNAENLLAASPAPPELRSAVWGALADTPGLRLLGPRTDSQRRRGYAVRLAAPGYPTVTYLVDPADGRLLEISHGPASAETEGWSVTYLTQGPRDTAPTPEL